MNLGRVLLRLGLLALIPGWGSAADLTVDVIARWGREPLTTVEQSWTNLAGQELRVSRIAALVSEVKLLAADGSELHLPGQFAHLDLLEGKGSFTLSGIPEGTYHGLEFTLGVPADLNHADPGRWPAEHPLNPVVDHLHWSWSGGYVFTALEGRWRNPADATERGFSYHLAGDEMLMTVRFSALFPVAETGAGVRLAWDLSRVLKDQKFDPQDGSESTHSGAGDLLAPQIAQRVERSWFWLGASAGVTGSAVPAVPPSAAVEGTTPWAFLVPAGFPQPFLPGDNPLTVEGVALGGALFRDPRLSGPGTQSCVDCHDPTAAFADPGQVLSLGAYGEEGTRNSMPLFNLAWQQSFTWDGRHATIREQVKEPITHELEMAADLDEVVARLAADPAMPIAFAAAFGTTEVSADRIGLALEQFLLVQVSADSKFDAVRRAQTQFTDEEARGLALFLTEYDPARQQYGADCFHCHGGPLFTDTAFKNNGLDLAATDDVGRGKITGAARDVGMFKTPTLRNVGVTAPYMHDGRFATLEEVVTHYVSAVQRTDTLDPNLAKHPGGGVPLSEGDQAALVAFLKTLTDPRWLPPATP